MKELTNTDGRTQELLSYVMQNCADKAIAILESGDFDHGVLEDVGGLSSPLALYQVSLCQHLMLSDKGWSDFYLPTIERNLAACEKLLDYWQERFHYPVDRPMDFSPFDNVCAHFFDWDLEELLEGTLDELVAMGYNRDEVLLCYAVLTHDSELLRRQIAKGTNPDVYISGDVEPGKGYAYDMTTYNALNECGRFVGDVVTINGFGGYWEEYEFPLEVNIRALCDLLQGAAYAQLFPVLKALSFRKKGGSTE